MKEADNQSRFPVIAPQQLLSQGFVWINSRRSFIKTRRFSGITSFLMLPAFILGFLFMALLIAILLFFFLLYVIFYLLISLPRLKKASRRL